jgi:hypothetical protein
MFVACGGGNDESGSGNAPTSGGSNETAIVTQEETTPEMEEAPVLEAIVMSMDEMLSVAETLNLGAFGDAIRDNIVRAEQTYLGNKFIATARVTNVERDYVSIATPFTFDGTRGLLRVYFNDTSVLADIDRHVVITVVGEITEIEDNVPIMRNAHFVTDTHEVTGTALFINGVRYSNIHVTTGFEYLLDDGINIRLPSDFRRDEGEIFTIEGKIFWIDENIRGATRQDAGRNIEIFIWEMQDVRIVEP